jgi:hypothetical protein
METDSQIVLIDETTDRSVPTWCFQRITSIRLSKDPGTLSSQEKEYVWTVADESGEVRDHPFVACWSENSAAGPTGPSGELGGRSELRIRRWKGPVGIFGLVLFVYEDKLGDDATLLDVFQRYDGRIVAFEPHQVLWTTRIKMAEDSGESKSYEHISVITGNDS